jgi:uncharacterized protein (TIGR03437 family)
MLTPAGISVVSVEQRLGRLAAALAFGAVSIARGQGVWERRADFPMEAQGVSVATVFGQNLYALCGMTANGAMTSLFVYNPVADRWAAGLAPPIPGGAQDCNVAATAGKLYVLGAVRSDGGAVDGNTYVYDPVEREWRMVGRMPTPRAASGVAALGTRIYVAGGVDASGASSRAFEVFETESRTWTRLDDLPTARDHLTAKAARGLVYAIGGRADRLLGTTEEYNPSTRAWRARAPMPTPRSRLGSGRSNGRIQVFGGEGCSPGGVCAQVEEYDPAADLWRTLAPMREARHSLNGATIDGRVFAVAGGPRSGASFSSALEALHLPPATPPVIARDGILNAASLGPSLSPGALASLFGSHLSQGQQQSLGPTPAAEINAVVVKLNGRPVPLVYVDPGQINFLVPLALPVGPVEATVTNAGVESAKATLPAFGAYSPAIFTLGESGSGQGVVLIAGTGLIAGGRKSPGFRLARKGEVLEIYCTGLGPVIDGRTVSVPAVSIAGAPAEVLSSGLAAGLSGVYQVNARIPTGASTGIAVPLSLRVGPDRIPSNEVTVAIR